MQLQVTALPVATSRLSEENWKDGGTTQGVVHCQETLTELLMAGLSLRCLGWTADGELDAADKLQLLQLLVLSAQPEVQIELIHLLEVTAVRHPSTSVDITAVTSL